METTIRGPFDRHRVAIAFPETGRTKQAMADDCDVNKIMARFAKTGILTHVAKYEGRYGDFTEALPYHEAISLVKEADAMFMSLPSKIRTKFKNDPGAFLEFTQDPENEGEMREMGLLPALPPEQEPKVAHGAPAAPETAPEPGAPKPATPAPAQ